MEIRELISRFTKSKDVEDNRNRFFLDILRQNPKIFEHYFLLNKLGHILNEGLVSGNFAGRANLGEHYKSSLSFDDYSGRDYVFLNSLASYRWFKDHKPAWERGLAVLVEPLVEPLDVGGGIFKVANRIAPREFRGLVLPAEDPNFQTNLKWVISIEKEVQSSLPIYDSRGNLFWPKRMSHRQIVEMLRAKETTTNEI